MQSLEHPDTIYLSAAQGWLELGNCVEACAELERITPLGLKHPDVLEVKWQIAVKQKHWDLALSVAECICERAPQNAFGWIHRSYCLHEMKRTQEAWDTLFPMAAKFPGEWLLCYNLACYACQLGHLEDAREWFTRSIELGDPLEINRLASEDPDLKPLFAPPV